MLQRLNATEVVSLGSIWNPLCSRLWGMFFSSYCICLCSLPLHTYLPNDESCAKHLWLVFSTAGECLWGPEFYRQHHRADKQIINQSQRSGTHTVQGWTANCSNVALTSLPVSRSQWQQLSYSYSWVRQGQQKVKGETQSGRVLVMWPFVPSNTCSLQMASEGMFSLLLN